MSKVTYNPIIESAHGKIHSKSDMWLMERHGFGSWSAMAHSSPVTETILVTIVSNLNLQRKRQALCVWLLPLRPTTKSSKVRLNG